MVWAASTVIALAGAAATVGAAAYSANKAGKAADKVAQGTGNALDETARQFDVTQANQAPYLATGKTALGTLANENDRELDQSKIQMDPGYEFGLKQGQQAIDRKTAAAGGRVSGAALKEAAMFGTDYAASGYSAAYGRANQARTDRLNRLAALAGIGQTATQNVAAHGANAAGESSALMIAAGNNAGASQLAQGNIWGNAGNQLAALYGRGSGTSSAGGVGAGNNYNYSPSALPINKTALEDLGWMNYGSGG